MWQPRKTRYFFSCAAGIAACVFLCVGRLWSAPDPVEELRQALVLRGEGKTTGKEFLDYREKTLKERVEALRTISDLRRALVEWKIPESSDPVHKLDATWRRVVGKRLTGALTEAAKSPDENVRLAVANLIAEMGPTVQALEVTERGGFARSLTGIVIALARDPAVKVRQEALRALGTINVDPDRAVPVLGDALKTAKDVGQRRMAADSLRRLVRVATNLYKKLQAAGSAIPKELEKAREDLIKTCKDVVEKIAAVSTDGAGIRDRDPEVRTVCIEAVLESGAAFDLPGAIRKDDFPPAGQKLTEEDLKDIGQQYALVQNQITGLQPLLQAMAGQGTLLRESAADASPRVKRAAAATLAEFGHMRLRLRQRVESLPVLDKTPKPVVTKDFDKMVLDSWSVMAGLLEDASSDLDVRRRAMEFLENLGDDGAAAIETLKKALADRNRFIRWAAARTIGNLPVAKAAAAVPDMAALLDDDDLDVRQAVARALERLGARASAAVEPLQAKILDQRGDPEFRVSVMYALASIGPEDTVSAIPLLTQAVADADVRVRRTAAETLGRYGRLAESAVPALREALGDDDTEVRQRAGDALLSILVNPPKK
jgi:HEAT repeat protein